MKKAITLLSMISLLMHAAVYSQTTATKGNSDKKKVHIKWTTNPFDKQVFIENKGQFDGMIPGNEKVYYMVSFGSIQAFFTANGIVYQEKKYPALDFSKGQDP